MKRFLIGLACIVLAFFVGTTPEYWFNWDTQVPPELHYLAEGYVYPAWVLALIGAFLMFSAFDRGKDGEDQPR